METNSGKQPDNKPDESEVSPAPSSSPPAQRQINTEDGIYFEGAINQNNTGGFNPIGSQFRDVNYKEEHHHYYSQPASQDKASTIPNIATDPQLLRAAIKQYLEALLNPATGADDLDTARWGTEKYVPLPALEKEPVSDSTAKQKLEQLKNSRLDTLTENDILIEYWLAEAKKENKETPDSRDKAEVDNLTTAKPVPNLLEALRQQRRVALLGGSGAGKTTTLRRIAIETARESLTILDQVSSSQLALPDGLVLPVYILLGGYDVAQLEVRSLIARAMGRRVSALSDEQALRILSRHLLILFDGVNEMPASTLPSSVVALRQEVEQNDQRAIFACRQEEYAGYFRDMTRLIVQPLDPDRIKQFLIVRKLENLINELEQPPLQELARVPYFLNLLCFIYAKQGFLPKSRPQLLKQFATEGLADACRRDSVNNKLEVEVIFTGLGLLAYKMVEERLGTRVDYAWAIKHTTPQVLEIALRAGLAQVVWLEPQSFNDALKGIRFAHQIVLEWLAATGLHNQLQATKQPMAGLVQAALYERWDEPLKLLCEELAWEVEVNEFSKTIEAIARSDVRLAQRIIGLVESRVRLEVQQQIAKRLVKLVRTGEWFEQKEAIAALMDTKTQIAHAVLFSFLADQEGYMRREVAIALPQIVKTLEELRPLLVDKDIGVRSAAVVALPRVGGTLEELRPLLADQEGYVRNAAASALPQIVKTLEELRPLLEDKNEYVRGAAASALPQIVKTLEELRPLLEDKNEYVRNAAVWVLPQVIKTLEEIRSLLVDRNKNVQNAAACTLPKVTKTIEALRLLFEIKNVFVQREVVRVLPKVGGTLEDLLPFLIDQDYDVRSEAASALPQVIKTIEELHPLLAHKDYDVRYAAVSALPQVVKTIEELRPLLTHKDHDVRNAAANALPQVGGTLEDLHPLLADKDRYVQTEAARVLPLLIKTPKELTQAYWLKSVTGDAFNNTRIKLGLSKNWQPLIGIVPAVQSFCLRLVASLVDFAVPILLVLLGFLPDYSILIIVMFVLAGLLKVAQTALWSRSIGLRLIKRTIFTDGLLKIRYYSGQLLPLLMLYLGVLNLPDLLDWAKGTTRINLGGTGLGLLGWGFVLLDNLWMVWNPYQQTLHDIISDTFLIRYRS